MINIPHIFIVFLITTCHHSFAFFTTPPEKLETTPASFKTIPTFKLSPQTAPKKFNNPLVTIKPKLQPTGRNLQFPNIQQDLFEFAPTPNSFIGNLPNYQGSFTDFVPFEPYFHDGAAHPFPPEPIKDDLNFPYPDERVLVPTGRQIVFRPLFAYRQMNAQRRRVYDTQPKPSSTTYEQKRRQGYPYNYSSYNYPYQYNNYYNKAQYDYVP